MEGRSRDLQKAVCKHPALFWLNVLTEETVDVQKVSEEPGNIAQSSHRVGQRCFSPTTWNMKWPAWDWTECVCQSRGGPLALEGAPSETRHTVSQQEPSDQMVRE